MKRYRPSLEKLQTLGLVSARTHGLPLFAGWVFHPDWFRSPWEFEISRNEGVETVSWLVAFGGFAIQRIVVRALTEQEWADIIVRTDRNRASYTLRREADQMVFSAVQQLVDNADSGLPPLQRERLDNALRLSSVNRPPFTAPAGNA